MKKEEVVHTGCLFLEMWRCLNVDDVISETILNDSSSIKFKNLLCCVSFLQFIPQITANCSQTQKMINRIQ